MLREQGRRYLLTPKPAKARLDSLSGDEPWITTAEHARAACASTSNPIPQLVRRSRRAGAMGTAEEASVRLHTVADDPAAAVLTDRRHPVNRALETVEDVDRALRVDLERHVVVVSADLASRHLVSQLLALFVLDRCRVPRERLRGNVEPTTPQKTPRDVTIQAVGARS